MVSYEVSLAQAAELQNSYVNAVNNWAQRTNNPCMFNKTYANIF